MATVPLQILVVEDYDVLRDAMVRTLERAGHRAAGVAHAEDVDDAAIGAAPDLYIIDINLPGEDGLSLTRRIRRSSADACIVLATARGALADRVAGYQAGADVYLAKPVAPEELIAIADGLSHRLNRGPAAGAQRLQLSTRSMLLRGPSAQAALTQSEVALLGAMARAADQTLERWQVAEHLSPQQPLSRDSLEVRVARLRRKLVDCGAEAPAIKSIRNVGYRLACWVAVQGD